MRHTAGRWRKLELAPTSPPRKPAVGAFLVALATVLRKAAASADCCALIPHPLKFPSLIPTLVGIDAILRMRFGHRRMGGAARVVATFTGTLANFNPRVG